MATTTALPADIFDVQVNVPLIHQVVAAQLAAARTVVLGCRDVDKGEQAAAGLRHEGLTVEVAQFDGAATATHEAFVRGVAERHGDIDLAVVAFAQLGDGAATSKDAAAAADLAHVNFTGAISATIAAWA